MLAVVGLGNPGQRYRDTPHNVGMLTVEGLGESFGVSWKKKFGCFYAKAANSGGSDLLLVLPQLYMNLSGEAIAPLLAFFRVDPENLLVVHDEADLELGQVKIKRGGGSAGHNGLKNIFQHSKTDKFLRVRVGVGRPPPEAGGISLADWVLRSPGPYQKELLKDAVSTAAEAVIAIASHGWQSAQQEFNQKKPTIS